MNCIICDNNYYFDLYEKPCNCDYDICEKCIKRLVYESGNSIKCLYCNKEIYKHKWYNYILDLFNEENKINERNFNDCIKLVYIIIYWIISLLLLIYFIIQ